ncbi:polysaccharide pyruvyl transferase family protein [Aureibaculum algae]|uniref:Polysaccharide pyruvyl transferase family protein n=1 Tax=Aureibaculum algae TaxID=2584122 RepID=A0A5B7TUL7_9FLAO|nr:polysaccharide pyruvyl transferase family protein [Aureibaculum algae]QCX38816.1 polysaccharide pyruvyl transferase family protein [Aureibaculum algae]
MKPNKILLTGYIGYKNFGDDLLFEIAIERIKDLPNIEVSAVVTDPSINFDYLYKYYPNLKIIRLNRSIPKLFYLKFNKVYYIGGGVFFDYNQKISSLKFLKKYLSNFLNFKIPKLLGTEFGGIGIGVGPYFHKQTLALHRQVLSSFEILGVRDKKSYDFLKGIKIKNLYLSNDLSVGYEKLPDNDIITSLKEVIICPRSYSHKPEFEKHIITLLDFAKFLEENNIKTHWVFLQEDDENLMNKIKQNFRTTIWNPDLMSILSFVKLFQNAEAVFSSRMHSLFIAGLVNTSFVAIELHPKLKYASELFYENPIILNPLDDLDKYKVAYTKLKNIVFNKSKLKKEEECLEVLNSKILGWLKK